MGRERKRRRETGKIARRRVKERMKGIDSNKANMKGKRNEIRGGERKRRGETDRVRFRE